jgi:methionyl-tRNA formyltransferase
LLKHLPAIVNGTLFPTEQKSEPTYSRLLQKADAVVDPKNDTAEYIARHVRAYELFPKTKLELYGHVVTITRVHVGANEADALVVPCLESDLVIDEIVAPSGRRISGADFLRGYTR